MMLAPDIFELLNTVFARFGLLCMCSVAGYLLAFVIDWLAIKLLNIAPE
jgi:hypothetical protein